MRTRFAFGEMMECFRMFQAPNLTLITPPPSCLPFFTQQVSRLTTVLDAKSNEVSTAMITFAEMQRMTAERESELKAKLALAEQKLESVQHERDLAREAESAARVQVATSCSDVNALKDRLAEQQKSGEGGGGVGIGGRVSEIAELKARLAVETSLKERAEQRESEERMERIATNAQLVAGSYVAHVLTHTFLGCLSFIFRTRVDLLKAYLDL